MIARRGFLAGMLAAAAAPAFVRSGVLMPSRALILPATLSEVELNPFSPLSYNDVIVSPFRIKAPDDWDERIASSGVMHGHRFAAQSWSNTDADSWVTTTTKKMIL